MKKIQTTKNNKKHKNKIDAEEDIDEDDDEEEEDIDEEDDENEEDIDDKE